MMAINYMAISGLMPFGSLQAGADAQAIEARFAMGFGGAVCLVYFMIPQISLSRLRQEGQLSCYPEPES